MKDDLKSYLLNHRDLKFWLFSKHLWMSLRGFLITSNKSGEKRSSMSVVQVSLSVSRSDDDFNETDLISDECAPTYCIKNTSEIGAIIACKDITFTL